MTIETILIINCVVLAVGAIALGLCISLYCKAEKKAKFFKERAEVLSKVYEDRVKAAYELGYKESKHAVQQKIAFEFYEKVLEWHPVTKTDKHSYSEFVELFKQWLKAKYGIEVIEVKDGE